MYLISEAVIKVLNLQDFSSSFKYIMPWKYPIKFAILWIHITMITLAKINAGANEMIILISVHTFFNIHKIYVETKIKYILILWPSKIKKPNLILNFNTKELWLKSHKPQNLMFILKISKSCARNQKGEEHYH